jgi:predicted DNA-binding helix-hairpin-helix protein
MDETLSRKLRILADAATYDASCSSFRVPGHKADMASCSAHDPGSSLCFARNDERGFA